MKNQVIKLPKKMNNRFFFLIFGFLFLFLISCNKDPDQSGCTDPYAANYNPAALRSDNSCVYNNAEQVIWKDGIRGGWNNNLQQGAFILETCNGHTEEIIAEIDSVNTQHSLFFAAGEEGYHKSVFKTLNLQNGRDFAEGSLRLGMRATGEDAPQFIKLYINGKIQDHSTCEPHKRSDFVEISTHSFNDSTFTEVNISLRDFEKIQMANIHVVCGIEFEAPENGGVEVNEIKWVANNLRD